MSNHISVKFFGLMYSAVPDETFAAKLSDLQERLRRYFPRKEVPVIQGFKFHVNERGIPTQQVEETHRELHMVDAHGLWGVKIGNSGVAFSTARYVSYDESVAFIEKIVDVITEVLGVYHFSRVFLRNINLFNLVEGEQNRFVDIKKESYWGRQEFDTLKDNFMCNGASTRHEYYSQDYKTQIQLASGVVLRNQSEIPQDEWDIWKLRGAVPVQNESEAKLLVDINAARHEAPVNDPRQQNNVSEYSWDAVKRSLDELHNIVNNVYFDITTKD
ncbi:TIGR04255 family protein [Gilvimarinus sp. 1_MG-2023]|uniref:TIGR04255 family protein n=1 Tax=Gilvimarinus sp. 1_MG-2023 TaxID=3062638 RepID=UPI0026E242B5|nr:TIGR04255 family protein [Gilvimarinus sp. 1_MG-2023]MDO6747833.1 TIGR04255 family protein [Gilvimarinus sp. 1_MG-2023]